jgi:tRNA acetyltransferase TAN1
VTCDKGQEKKCLAEMHDLLSQYVDVPQREQDQANRDTKEDEEEELDIEASIAAELNSLKPKSATSTSSDPWTMITLDIPCVSFIRLSQSPTPIDPVALVHKICTEAASNSSQKRSRYIKRLTPISLIRKSLGGGLESLCSTVLPPHFGPSQPPWKFAIRPSVRNKNNQLDRDVVIKVVADEVGKLGEHKVDLTNYDKCILVDVYRNVVGMSIVGKEYERLKRYNLAEIYEPGKAADDARVKGPNGQGPALEH